jgi:Fe2+ or Zn2+ uptake regulation protein
MNKTKEWLDCLLENGYRLTAPRRAVVETVSTSTHVLSPLEYLFDRPR